MIDAYVARPGDGKRGPAVVGLHGCGGLLTGKGQIQKRELDWAARFTAAGYTVIFPDSFNPRGFRQICTEKSAERSIRPRDRAADALAALAWAQADGLIDGARVALLGWSNGASTTLQAVNKELQPPGADFRTAIAFYPGCRPIAESATWAPRVPTTVLIGAADDWTPPEPCRVLAAKGAVRLIEYPGAYHGFDAPESKVRIRTGVGLSVKGTGEVHVGTDPAARAAAIDEVGRVLAAAFK